MKPAMQAVACRARTNELRQRIGSRSTGSDGSVSPGRWIGVRSGVSRPATTQTAPSSASAIATLSASQPRKTAHGRPFQASSADRVSRIPCEKTCPLATFIADTSAANRADLSSELAGLLFRTLSSGNV
jgi:Mg-chelatase subunit ChlD